MDRFEFFTIPDLRDQNLCPDDVKTIIREFHIGSQGGTNPISVTEEDFTSSVKNMILYADIVSQKQGEHVFTSPDVETVVPKVLHPFVKSKVESLLGTKGARGKWVGMTIIRGSNIFEPDCRGTLLTLNLCLVTFEVSRVGWWPWFRGVKQVKVGWKNVHTRVSPIFISMNKLYS
jgi:hypothetical protein